MKAFYKSELANAAGVSRETFRKWCRECEATLQTFGYHRRDHLLTPGAVEFLCEKYCIMV